MHPADLRYVWVCYECQQCFVFENDKDEHRITTGHKEFKSYEISEVLDKYGETNLEHRQYVGDEH
jgi:hypothetical protein